MMRLAGAAWRGLLWVVFPPLGWYRSRQATARRRHNAMMRELRRPEPNVPGVYWLPPPQYPPPGLPPSASLAPPRR